MRIKDNVMLVLDAETQALVKKLLANPGELITGIGGLGSLVELLSKLLAEQTPAQRLELTGALQVESNNNGNLISDPAIRALSLALVARAPGGETDASEPGDETE
jgi:Iap family predicted aminopeptidase